MLYARASLAAGDLDATLRERCPAYVAWLTAESSRTAKPLAPMPPEETPTDPQLRAELLRMQRDDQEARAHVSGSGASNPSVQHLFDVDARNLAELKLITVLVGFPDAQVVGRDGVGALWLLVQHADADPVFQSRALEDLQPLVAQGDLGRDSMAMLTDRVRLARGEPQVYGTQFLIDQGVLTLRLTEDVDHLEERRRSVGLPPLADYECALRVVYGTPDRR